MPEESNPYAAVLADLERERDQITSMIAMIKRRMGMTSDDAPITASPLSGTDSSVIGQAADLQSDAFFGMSIPEAIKKFLAITKRPRRTAEIAKALEAGGLAHTSKNWVATVQSTLSRMRSIVVKVPNGWGLLEWYPGRNFEKPTKSAAVGKKKRGRPKKIAAEPVKRGPGRPKKVAEPTYEKFDPHNLGIK